MSGFGGIIGGVAGAAVGFLVGGPVGAQVGWLAGSMIGNLLDPPKYETPEPAMQKVQLSEYGRPIPILYGTDRFAGTVIWQKYPFDKHKEKSGGKGTSPEVTSTTFSTSFAVLLCEGPISDVIEIYADGRLIWPNGDDDIDFTLYTGTETQPPDPTMEAELGVGQVPAHRGYAYVVFTDLMLKSYGERIPSLEFVVTTEAQVAGPIIRVASTTHDPQWDTQTTTGRPGDTIVAWSTHWSSSATLADPASVAQTVVQFAGGSYQYRRIGTYVTSGGDIDLVATEDVVTGSGSTYVALTDTTIALPAGVPTGVNYNDAFGVPAGLRIRGASLSQDGTLLFLYCCTDGSTNADTWYKIIDGVIVDSGTISPTISKAQLGYGNAGGGSGLGMVSMFENNGDVCWFYSGSSPVASPNKSVFIRHFVSGNFELDASAGYGGEIQTGIDYSTTPDTYANAPSIYVTETGYAGTIGGTQTALWSRFVPVSGVPLSDIVADISSRTPLDVTEYDTSALTDLVHGYRITSQMEARNAIQPLRQAYFFDGAEIEGVVTFVKRGGASVVTVPDADLAARPGGDAPPGILRTTRKQEADLPQRVYVSFLNPSFDYQSGTEYDERQVTGSQSQTTVSLPIAMLPTTAKSIAGALVWDAYRERDGFTFWLPRKYWKYDPTDVMTVNGIDIRVERITAQASGVLEFEGTVSSPSIFSVTESIIGGGSSSGPQVPPAARVLTELVLLDIPIITQNDAPFGFYAAMGPAEAGPWGGATLFKSLDDGLTWASIASTSAADVIGVTTAGLDDYAGDITLIDEVSTVEVTLTDPTAELSSATADAFDNGANLCAIKSGTTWELLQFRDAALTAPQTYTLTGFYRGRKGTAPAIPGHAADDTFVLLPCINVDAPESELNLALKYKAVTFGGTLASATAVTFTNTGESAGGSNGEIGSGTFDQIANQFPIKQKLITAGTYTLTAGDRAHVLAFDNATGCTVTLPTGLPKHWWTFIENVGAGDVDLTPATGPEIDQNGGAALTLTTDQGTLLQFNGTDYWTSRGIGGSGGGGGGGAPTNAQYLTLATNGTLTDERVATGSSNISITDAGAGSTSTFDLTTTGVTAAVYGDTIDIPQLTIDKYGRITSAKNIPVVGFIETIDEGSLVDADAIALNFVGAGVTATDAGGGVTQITIPGGEVSVSDSFLRYAIAINSATPAQIGFGFSNVANAPTQGTLAATTLMASQHRVLLSSTSTGNTGAQINGGVTPFWLGNGAGLGGFQVEIWFGVETTDTTLLCAVGLFVGSANLSPNGTDPSTLTDRICMGCDKADTNMYIMHNDASGTCTKVSLGASFPKTSGVYYKLTLTATANASTVDYLVERLDSAASASGTLSSDLPANTAFMAPKLLFSKGAVVTTISGAFIKCIARAAP